MFDSFQSSGPDAATRKRLILSVGASSLGYAGLVVAAVVLGGAAKHVIEEKRLEVVFHRAPEPPPLPPPPLAVAPSAPLVSAPRQLKRKPPEAITPPPRLRAPEKLPDAPAPEKDAADDAVAAAPPGEGDAAGIEGGSGDAPGTRVASLSAAPPPPARRAPIQLPEDATPPTPEAANRLPEYPAQMRAEGKEETVILKVVITEAGTVEGVQVMRGGEPFLSAALLAVKSWKFSPAIWQGRPIPVFKIIKLPFKLKL